MEPMIEYALCFAGLMIVLVASIHIHTEMIIKQMRDEIQNNPEAVSVNWRFEHGNLLQNGVHRL